jgi:hypothetical protein
MKKANVNLKANYTLVNRFTNEVIECDILHEEEIEGKKFFVIKAKNRILKLSKEAFNIKKPA